MIKIGFIPFYTANNNYTDNIKSAFKVLGSVEAVNYKCFKIYHYHYYDLVVLSWRENYFINDSTGNLDWYNIFKEYIRLFLFKVISKKICIVVHNHYPHKLAELLKQGNIHAVPLLAKFNKIQNYYRSKADVLICHSGELSQYNCAYVPHPKYFDAPLIDPETTYPITYENHYIIFGRVEPYKNIESIFSYLDHSIKILICGTCSNLEYLHQLKHLAPPNVSFMNEFIPESKAKQLIKSSRGLIMLGNNENMIVSGSFHFGMSCATKIFALTTPYTQWYQQTYGDSNVVLASTVEDLVGVILENQATPFNQESSHTYHKEHAVDSVSLYLKRLFIEEKSC